MLSTPVRILLRKVYVIEKIPKCCKCTSNGKPNIIKTLNEENKYLYGGLLETQKQRKKRINKVADGVSGATKKSVIDSKSEIATNLENKTENKIVSKKIPKKSQINKIDSDSSVTPYHLSSDGVVSEKIIGVVSESSRNGPSNQVSSTKNVSKKLSNSKTCRDASTTSPILNKITNKNVITTNSVPESSDEFVFKSVVPIDEVNYPLHNPEKLDLFSQESPIESVLNYTFTDSLIKNYSKFHSVSKIMEETMSDKNKLILSKWRKNMIAEMGEENFNKYNAALKVRGSEFHLAVRNTVLGEAGANYSEVTANALQSLSWMLEFVSKPMAVESIVGHPKMEYKGIPDCVAMFRNVPVVIDWKLSDKPKKELKDTYEAPVQISAYIGALNHDPNYRWSVSHGLVAVAYTSGDPCDVFLLAPEHCQIYWRHWLMRFDKFKARSHLHVHHNIDEKALEFI